MLLPGLEVHVHVYPPPGAGQFTRFSGMSGFASLSYMHAARSQTHDSTGRHFSTILFYLVLSRHYRLLSCSILFYRLILLLRVGSISAIYTSFFLTSFVFLQTHRGTTDFQTKVAQARGEERAGRRTASAEFPSASRVVAVSVAATT